MNPAYNLQIVSRQIDGHTERLRRVEERLAKLERHVAIALQAKAPEVAESMTPMKRALPPLGAFIGVRRSKSGKPMLVFRKARPADLRQR